MKTDIYKKDGKKTGSIDLPESVFAVKWNPDLVHQVVHSMLSNARAGTAQAHTKDRSEVRGGGKKPWKQKGLGRARHGSRRSPIWVGGGVTFGPRKEKDYSKKINKKMSKVALYSTLSKKNMDGEILFVESLDLKTPKAKDAKNILKVFGEIKGYEDLVTKKENTALITTVENNLNTKKSFANFGNVKVTELRNLNPVDLLSYKYLLVISPEESVKLLASKGQKDIKK
jgi:large subunit ribosomal protein L4